MQLHLHREIIIPKIESKLHSWNLSYMAIINYTCTSY